MGRPEYSLTTRIVCLLALGVLAGCGAPAQTVSNLQYAPGPTQPLIGSTPATLSAEFGQPAILRVDGAAQVWLYHAGSCGLNLILYPDASGTPRVAAASATDGGPPADCTASLSEAHFDGASPATSASLAVPVPALATLERPASS